ncbi:MAG: SulP family inorganic anion transporter [Gemmatimonadetes bacterium]|nr:SulP family inorganic anion transporter [Gemmatimonadota bacterium]MDA1103680.1 SulP family inorganic anion transporter [Gemmatimonadota bacterium]
MRADPPGRMSLPDVLAGLSVALVLIPQSMAYAELAGLPPHHGLYAATLPLIAAAFLASSPYLSTGPVALTGLLTFSALVPLAPVGTAEFAALAALLALIVGLVRFAVGWFKAGWLVYLMSHSMMRGFLSAAAILIFASQVPGLLGSAAPADEGVLQRAWWALAHRESWGVAAIGLSAFTIVTVVVAGRIHPLVPGVLLASAVGVAYSVMTGYTGPTVGAIPSGLPPFSADLPWARLPSLIVPGLVISVIGFAEGVSISRLLASQDRQRWVADREFLSKGMACVVAAFTGGLPVGGSLSRTSLNRLAGARSRWSGLVTGVAVLCFLPFADVLSPLPKAVLAGIVVTAISKLIRPQDLWRIWRISPPQALVGWGTFAATLILSPQVDQAILLGIAMSAAVHLWRELKPHVTSKRVDDTLVVELSGVLWFGSAPALEDQILAQVADEPDVTRVVIRCGGLGRIDLSGAYTLHEMINQGSGAGYEVVLEDVPDHARRLLSAVGVIVDRPVGQPTGTGTTSPP